jgi:hypothetical protein
MGRLWNGFKWLRIEASGGFCEYGNGIKISIPSHNNVLIIA